MRDEVVGDPILPGFEQFEKGVKATQATARHALLPEVQAAQRIQLRTCGLEDRRQLVAQFDRLFECWAQSKQPLQTCPLFLAQLGALLSEWPHQMLEVVVLLNRKLFLEAFDLLLAQTVDCFTIVASNV